MGETVSGNRRMRLQRLLTMTPAEIACRSQQVTVKTVDRLVSAKRSTGNARHLVFDHLEHNQDLEKIHTLQLKGETEQASGELLDYFRRQLPPRFFEGMATSEMPDLVARHCPDHVEKVCRLADGVCHFLFPILGYGRLSYGAPVNWHLDTVASVQAPVRHWSLLDPLDCEQVGDNKVIWELNRHQWILDLGQAYQFTGNEKYAQVFEGLVSNWIKHNPVGIGINWSSSLEVAIRLISWSWGLMFFRNSSVMTPALFASLLNGIRDHACHIENYLSYYFSPNTHLTGEALGLCYAGMLFPEFKDARRWHSTGKRILDEQIGRQVYGDGVYFEQSTRYQYYTIDIYLHYIFLSGRNGAGVHCELTERLKSMFKFLLAVRHPNGDMPQIGDADGGWLLPLVRREPADFRGLFATGAVAFRRGDFAWGADGRITPEVLWLLGKSALDIWPMLKPLPPGDLNPAVFKQGGYAVLRTHWESDAHQVIVDFGPLGCQHTGGHGHADLLSIQCCVFGEPYIVDTGTGSYRSDSKWRKYFRGACAHSTVTVDGMNQAVPDGPFTWQGKRPAARLNRCEITESWQLVDALRENIKTSQGAVTHRRRVLFANDGWWLVIDDLLGHGEHNITARFQFAPLELRLEDEQWARVSGQRGSALLLKCFSTSQVEMARACGSIDPLAGWISSNYGQHQAAPVLTFSVRDRMPVRMVTLMLPLEEPESRAPGVTMNNHNGKTELFLPFLPGNQLVSIGEDTITLEEAP